MILYRPSKVDGPRTSVKATPFTKLTHPNTNARNRFGRSPVIISIPHHHKGHASYHSSPSASTSFINILKREQGERLQTEPGDGTVPHLDLS